MESKRDTGPFVDSATQTRSGIDTTLIDEMLALTPEERLRYHDAVLECIFELRQALGDSADENAS
jgi:hypothetical protein